MKRFITIILSISTLVFVLAGCWDAELKAEVPIEEPSGMTIVEEDSEAEMNEDVEETVESFEDLDIKTSDVKGPNSYNDHFESDEREETTMPRKV